MTTNVPQDVLEDALLAGFEVFKRPDGSEGIETFDAGENITDDLLKFLQLRAQRQQGAEPVGTVGPMPGTQGFTMATFEASKVPVGTNLYTPPPQANALVAAAYRKAAEIVGELENKSRDNVISSALKIAKSGILSAIPADAEAALRERDYAMCMKAAVEAYIAGQEHGRHGKTADLDAIVNSVLGEGK
jgi:hypothetical protein